MNIKPETIRELTVWEKGLQIGLLVGMAIGTIVTWATITVLQGR